MKEELKATGPEVSHAQSYKGKLNIYVCDECHGHIVTVDKDDGVTPFMIGCEAKGCKAVMKSSFYRVFDQSMAPTHEWYRPTEPEIATLQRGAADHVRQGGLMLRRCDGAPMKHPLTRR